MLVNDVHLPRNEGQPCAALFLTSMYVLPGSVGLALLVRPHRACCFLYRHSPLGMFLVPRETNISWKMSVNDHHFSEMSVNDQHFFKSVRQWPTFLEKYLSMTDIWKMSVNHQQFGSKRWLMAFIFPCTLTHIYECFSLKVCVCYSLVGESYPSLDKTSAIFAASVAQHFLKNACQRPTFLL